MRRILLALWIVLLLVGVCFATNTPSIWTSETNGNYPTATRYYSVMGNIGSATTEASRTLVIPCNGTISKLYAYSTGDPGAGTSWTVTLRKSTDNGGTFGNAGSPGNLAVTLDSATYTGATDSTNSYAVSAGELVDIAVTVTGSPTPAAGGWSLLFTPTTTTETVLAGTTVAINLSTSVTEYIALAPNANWAVPGTVGDQQIVIPCNGTVKKLYVSLSAAPGSGTRTFAVNVDGVDDTNLKVALTGTGTGAGKTTGNNTSDTVSVTAGQKLTISSSLSGTVAAATARVAVVFVPDVDGNFVLPLCNNGYTMSTVASKYAVVLGTNTVNNWGAGAALEPTTNAFTAKSIYIVLSQAPGVGKSWDFTLYDNGSPTSLHKAISGGTDTTGNYSTDVSISANHTLSINANPTNSPAASTTAMVSILGYVAPTDALPTVTTQDPSDLANTTATGNYTITSAGAPAVDDDGVIFSATNATPTYGGADCTAVSGSGVPHQSGAQTASMTGLTASTRYYVVGYAHNSTGYGYGSVKVFSSTPRKIYVDSSGGDDSNDGYTDSTAFKTLSKIAALTLISDDTVYLKRGSTFRESLPLAQSGTTGHLITYRDYSTGNKPIIHGGTVTTGWGGGPGVYTVGSITTCGGVIEDGVILPAAGTSACSDGNWFRDGDTNILYYKPTSGVPGDHTVDRLVRTNCMSITTGGSYTTLSNIKFIGQGVYSNGTSTTNNFTISGCDFSNNNQGINLTTTATDDAVLTVQNCTFDYCRTNIYLIQSGDKRWTANISGNTITHSNQPGYNGATENFPASDREGMSFQNLYNASIHHNEISGGAADAVAGAAIVHSIVYSTAVTTTGNTIYDNYIHDYITSGIIYGTGDSSTGTNVNVYNNIITNSAASVGAAIRVNGPQTSATPSNIANNTIYGCGVGIELNSLPDYYNIKNNIVSNCTIMAKSGVALGHNIFSNNCYVGAGSGTPFYYSGGSHNKADWQTNYGDANMVTDDPVFVNGGGSYALATDFRLNASSAKTVYEGGYNLSATFTTDYAGTTRTVPWSMGAYEYQPAAGTGMGLDLTGGNFNPYKKSP